MKLNDIKKRLGVACAVILSCVLVLTGVLGTEGANIGRVLQRESDASYAAQNTAKATEESVNKAFPELTSGKKAKKGVSKSETVYMIMDADGNEEETVVNEWLQNPEKRRTIKDRSDLTDISNTSGDEKFSQDGSKLTWEADGNDIKYTGNYSGDLPVSVKITYYLDGEEVTASEIAGKSGEIEIHFNYYVDTHDRVSVDGKGYEVTHPYVMASGVLLDNDHFRNVEVTNGKCISEGDNTICVGIALPGLSDSLSIGGKTLDIPDNVIIKAVTDSFRLDGTYTAALTGLLGDIDISSNDLTDKLGELESGLDKLSSASSKLVKGSRALAKGTKSLANGTNELSGGASQLKSGASKLADGTSALKEKSGKLASGIKKLYEGSESLSKGTSGISKGTKKAVKGAKSLSDGLAEISGNSGALNEGTEKLEENIFDTATTQLRQGLIDGGIPAAVANRFTLTPSTYKKTISDIVKIAPDRKADLDDLEAMLDNLEAYVEGVKSYTGGVDKVAEGSTKFYSQLKQLADGAKKVDKGASKMKNGLSELSDNIPALKKGINKLNKGASSISGGASQVSSGASALNKGAKKLKKGASTLADGMNKFDKQGIRKFVNSLNEYDIADLLGKFKALIKASGETRFIGGAPSNIDGESKIIFKTGAIEAEGSDANPDAESEE